MWHGCAHIDPRYPDRSAQEDMLTYGAGLIRDLGFDAIKLELSVGYASKYAGQEFGSPTTLTELAQEAAFASVIADFDRIIFTAFSLAQSGNNQWAGAWTKEIGDDIEDEMYALGVHLLTTYSGKHFIIQSWESDWQLLNSFDPADAVPFNRINAFRDYHRRRQRAIRAARAAVPGSTSTLRYAIECNRVLDGWGARVHRDIVRNVRPDVVSLSPYEAINAWAEEGSTVNTQAELEASIEERLTEVVARVRANLHPRHTDTPIYIGEYGWPSNAPYFTGPFDFDVGALHQKVIDVAESLGLEGEAVWQGLDNETFEGQSRGFWLWTRDGSSDEVGPLSAAGEFYQALLSA